MRNFLLIFCFVILNACSLTGSDYGIDYTSIDGATFYGTEFAFVYGDKIEVGSITWTRSEEISSGTYIYTYAISATYDDEYGVEIYSYLYMKVEEMSNGIALYSVTTTKQNAENSTGYQLYTYYMTSSPYEYVY